MRTLVGRRRRNLARQAAAVAISTMLTSASLARAIEAEQPKSDEATIPLELFRAPRAKSITQPEYPFGERKTGNEGWVNVSYMINPSGKPYEIVVTQSSGNKELERAALKAAENWTFEPGSLNGKPVESSHQTKVIFTLAGPGHGARPEFIRHYKALQGAFDKNDKVAAEAAIGKLKIQNLYEDAYYGMASYFYARRWGNDLQQLAGLRRAIARESNALFLPRDTFALALRSLFILEVNTHDYASAMETWGKLQKAGVDEKTLATLKPAINQMQTLRVDDRAYSVSGYIADDSWHFNLFKKRFSVVVSKGHVSQIKLRCRREFVFFAFNPELQYRVADNAGACLIELIGDPETTFDLIQS